MKFGDGIEADKTHVSISGRVATISFDGSDDKVTLNLSPMGATTLAFADGTSASVTVDSPLAWLRDAPST